MPKLNKANIRLAFQIVILLGVVLFCYAPSFDSFFVADDIWQVNFAHKVFDGRLELILRNFTSNYLQLPSFGFYRPVLGFTFLLDYFFWCTNALGYHITSVLLYISAVMLLFLLVRTMTRTWPDYNSSWAAFFTALLFAVTPLHCEDVSWISGRADLLAAPFYLLSFWLVVKSHQAGNDRRLYFYALASFFFALLSKEIAVGLPAVIAAYFFIWPEEARFGEPVEKPKRVATAKQTEVEEEESDDGGKSKKPATARQVAHAERVLKTGKRKKKKRKKQNAAATAGGAEAQETEVEEPDDGSSSESEEETTPAPAIWNVANRFKLALHRSWPFFAIGIVYLAIRFKVLGEVMGGYGGMMGGALGRHLLLRWFDPVNLYRILLPFPLSLSTDLFIPQWILGICLVICLCIVLVRLLAQARPFLWLGFLFIWMATAILPLAKLWGVGLELETSRLLFFFTMAYSTLWPVLLFHPPKPNATFKLPAESNRALGFVSAFVFVVMSITMMCATFGTNCFWYTAGHELKKIWQDTVQLASGLKKDEKVIVLGIPKDYKGAHVNFNGSTFHHMLRPPFTDIDLSKRVITFEPFIIGPFEVINSDRLKALMRSPDIKGPYVWNRQDNKYKAIEFGGQRGMPETLELPFRISDETLVGKSIWQYHGKGTSEVKGNGIVMHDTDDGAALQIQNLNISPLEYDFIEFTIRGAMKPGDPRALVPMAVGWNSMSVKKDRFENWSVMAVNVPKLKEANRFRLQLSHFWQWFSAGTIKSFVIRLFDADTIQVSDVRLVKANKLLPFAGLKDLVPLNSGEYVIGTDPIVFLFDGSQVPNAVSAQIEITKANYFFDNYLMGTRESAVAHTLTVDMARGATQLKPYLFQEPAYYEIRVRCLDADKKPVGVWSEAVSVVKMGDGLDTYLF